MTDAPSVTFTRKVVVVGRFSLAWYVYMWYGVVGSPGARYLSHQQSALLAVYFGSDKEELAAGLSEKRGSVIFARTVISQRKSDHNVDWRGGEALNLHRYKQRWATAE